MLYSSIDNSKIKEIKKLNQKKYRDQNNTFLVEGEHLILEAYKKGCLKELLLTENTEFELDVETNYITESVSKFITSLDTPTNMVGVCSKRENKITGNKILILDEIQDPGNLGTIIRSAVAFNIDTIILSGNCADVHSSKVIRASQGMLFNINIVTKNLEETILNLKNENYKIYGTKVSGGKDVKQLAKNEKFAIIMGNEGHGVKDSLLGLCDEYLYIAMNKTCESLNVAIATSIILYEMGDYNA